MKKITDLITKGEIIVPSSFNTQTIEVCGAVDGEDCWVTITKNYVSVLTRDWAAENPEQHRFGLEPKVLAVIEMEINTEHVLSDLGEKFFCQIEIDGIEKFTAEAMLIEEGHTECRYICWPVL